MNDKELEDKLSCILADVGTQIGQLIKCIVIQEVDMHMQRITQLNSILNGTTCNTNVESTAT